MINKVGLFLSIVALLFGGFVYKQVLDQNILIAGQNAKLSELYAITEKIEGRVEAVFEIGEGIRRDQNLAAESKEAGNKKVRLQLFEGYYCLSGVKGEGSVVYFDGVNRMKTWGDADGTDSFKSMAPDGAGKYIVAGKEIIMTIKENDEKKNTINRTAKVLSQDKDGYILEFDFYNTIFSYNACAFKK